MSLYDLDNLDDPFSDDIFEVGNSVDRKNKNSAIEPTAGSTWSEVSIDHDSTLILEEQFLRDKAWAYADENLGEGFDKFGTQWLSPDTALIAEYKKKVIHKYGKPFKDVKVTIDYELPLGVRLYFQFVKTMIATMLWMSFFSLPSLVLAYSGSRTSSENKDVLGLFRLSIANIGYAENDLYNGHSCSAGAVGVEISDDICITIIGYELSTEMISLIISVFEIIQIFVFFSGVRKFRKKYVQLTNVDHPSRRVSVTDYTVMVEHLPAKFTLEELVAHFSALYQLSNKDFCGRLPIEDARTVDVCDNSGDLIFLNTWVADCRVFRAVGRYVALAKSCESKMRRLYINRAKMKMYGENTLRQGGESKRRYVRCENAMLKTAASIDRVRRRILKPPPIKVINENVFWRVIMRRVWSFLLSCGAKFIHFLKQKLCAKRLTGEVLLPTEATPPPVQQQTNLDVDDEDYDPGSIKMRSSSVKQPSFHNVVSKEGAGIKGGAAAAGPSPAEVASKTQLHDDDENEEDAAEATATAESAIPPDSRTAFVKRWNSAPPVAAFVTFQYNESMVRCLEDYNEFHTFPNNLRWMLFPPKNMLFKGHKLKISQAPEPEEIIWENVDLNSLQKLFFKMQSILIMSVVLVIFFCGLLWASSFMRTFALLLPDSSFCATIPQLYLGNESYAHQFYSMKFVRPARSVERDILDSQCTAVFNGTIGLHNAYFFYANLESSTKPPSVRANDDSEFTDDFYNSGDDFYGGNVSISTELTGSTRFASYKLLSDDDIFTNLTIAELCAPNIALNSACPIGNSTDAAARVKFYCPCITTDQYNRAGGTGDDHATPAACDNFATAPNKLAPSGGLRMLRDTYQPSDVGLCYCRGALQTALESLGLLSILTDAHSLSGAESLPEAQYCEDVFFQFSQSTFLLWLSILWTVAFTVLIARLVPLLVATQRRYCQRDIEIAKFNMLGISYFLLLCLSILGSHGTASLSSDSSIIARLWSLGIFRGPFADFTAEWFGSIGFYLVSVYILTALLPMVGQCIRYMIIGPLFNKYYIQRFAKKRGLFFLSTQYLLNSISVGPQFQPGERIAFVLPTLFLTIMYSGGLPIFLILGTLSLTGRFLLDKWLISRVNTMPSKLTVHVIETALKWLPIAGILRALFSCWMLSTPGMFSAVLPDFAGYSGLVFGYDVSMVSLHNYKKWILPNQQTRIAYVPAFLFFIYDRILLENVFPVFAVAVLFLLNYVGIFIITWEYSPLTMLRRLLEVIFERCTRKGSYSKSMFYIHPFDLLAMDHPLRKESAPFTGEYFKYLEYRGALRAQGCCCSMVTCIKEAVVGLIRLLTGNIKSTMKLSDKDVEEGWVEVVKAGDFAVKTKQVKDSVVFSKAVMNIYFHSKIKLLGQPKSTYDVIREYGYYTYAMRDLDSYKLTWLLLIGELDPSVVATYEKLRAIKLHDMEVMGGALRKPKKFDPFSLDKVFPGEEDEDVEMDAATRSKKKYMSITDSNLDDYMFDPKAAAKKRKKSGAKDDSSSSSSDDDDDDDSDEEDKKSGDGDPNNTSSKMDGSSSSSSSDKESSDSEDDEDEEEDDDALIAANPLAHKLKLGKVYVSNA